MVLAVAPFVGGGGDDVSVRTEVAAAGSQKVRAQALGSPTAVRELLSETTSTLVAATGATTTTTAPSTSATSTTVPATTTTEAQALETTTSTTAAPTTTTQAPRSTTSQAPSTTAAPTTAPPTTAAPTTTTTTAPPARSTSSGDEGYAYDDPRSTQVWYDLADCESGGNWSIDTGNGYYGGLQFSLPTWESVGGTGYPHEHPAATQIDMGRRLQARQGWGAWPHCSEKLGLR